MRTEGLSGVINIETDRTFAALYYVIYSGTETVRLDGQPLNIHKTGCGIVRSQVSAQEHISSGKGASRTHLNYERINAKEESTY